MVILMQETYLVSIACIGGIFFGFGCAYSKRSPAVTHGRPHREDFNAKGARGARGK